MEDLIISIFSGADDDVSASDDENDDEDYIMDSDPICIEQIFRKELIEYIDSMTDTTVVSFEHSWLDTQEKLVVIENIFHKINLRKIFVDVWDNYLTTHFKQLMTDFKNDRNDSYLNFVNIIQNFCIRVI